MSGTDDYLAFITPTPDNFGYRQGVVTSWSTSGSPNQVRVGDGFLNNLPIISQSDQINIRQGDTVAIIRYNDSYAVLGKIKTTNAGTPWAPIPLYPQFQTDLAASTTGYWTVNVGTLASWEGRMYATHHSFISVDGVWGQASGSNTVTYELQIGGVRVGTWTTVTALEVANKGPFDITPFKDQQFIKVEVKITSSVGSGTVACQVLACYLR